MITRKSERERAQTNEQDIRHRPDSPPPVTVVSHYFRFDRNCGGENRNEKVFHWVLDQGERSAGVLAIAMVSVEVVAMDISMEGVQRMVNETVDEENKRVVWQNKRGNKKTLVTSFFVVVMYRHTVLAAASIPAIAAQR